MSIKRTSKPGKREKARRGTFSQFVRKRDRVEETAERRGGGRVNVRKRKRGGEDRSEKAVEIKRRLIIYAKVHVSRKFVVDPHRRFVPFRPSPFNYSATTVWWP